MTLGQGPLAVGIKNGFATARTDGGVADDGSVYDWQFDHESGTNDATLIDMWVHDGTHVMTVVGKAVTTAIHAEAPKYSYFQGGSGGGRQGLASAQHHPTDYDGIISQMPAINWQRIIASGIWPALVMKELNNALPVAKLEAFRKAAVQDFNQKTSSGHAFVTCVEPHRFDPFTIVGEPTESGPITDLDARAMQLIWEGPHTPDGDPLWFGLRPGAESWCVSGPTLGLCTTTETGDLVPEPWGISVSWFQTWVLQDPDWDWTTLTFEEYARLFQLGIDKFPHVAADNPDLNGFQANGSKLLITHGTDDQVIVPEGSRHYYDRVLAEMGGFDEVSKFARLFLCFGEGHGIAAAGRFTHDLAVNMVALMKWVEYGVAPDELAPVEAESAPARTDHTLGVLYQGSLASKVQEV